MTLYGMKFFIFFCLTLLSAGALKLLIKDKLRLRRAYTIFLGLISYIFIAMINWRFCLSVLAVTLIAYISGMLIESTEDKKEEKYLWLSG